MATNDCHNGDGPQSIAEGGISYSEEFANKGRLPA